MCSAAAARQRLADLFADGEWASERVLVRRRPDRNAFVTANILLVLGHAGIEPGTLAPLMDAARAHLAAYRVGHRAWHWPLRGGRSAMADAPPLWRHRLLDLSPDADCTCLVQLARRDAGLDEPIAQDLAFYRADGDRFRLPGFQRRLSAVAGSFLTWFPPRERCRPGTLETVDAGVDANILWYLGVTGRREVPGAAETLAFVAAVVRERLALRAPFRVSPYYPSPAVLLYLIARAAAWGRLEPLLALRGELLDQLAQCPTPTALAGLCREAAIRLCGGPATPVSSLAAPDGRGDLYVGPLLAWPLQRAAALEGLAAHPMTHLGFRSEALEWALHLSLAA